MSTREPNRNKRWAWLIGIGLALAPLHNQWLTDLVTSDGEVGFFIPAFGTAIWFITTLLFITWNWGKLSLGDKKVWIPLLVISSAIALSGVVTAQGIQDKFATLAMGFCLFGLYVASRSLGKELTYPLAIGAVVASIGVILYAVIYRGEITGGFVFGYNYDIVVGYVILGVALFNHRWQWLTVSLALVAMFLTGSPEAVFVVAVWGLVWLLHREYHRKAIYTALLLIVVALVWFGLGYGQDLYGYTVKAIENEPSGAYIDDDVEGREPVGYRLMVIEEAMSDIKPFGTGYNITEFREGIVHNVPLIIVQQLGYPGIIAGLAFLWLVFYCLIRTKWRYAWALLIALCVFDHYIWTQMGTYFWVLAGISFKGQEWN